MTLPAYFFDGWFIAAMAFATFNAGISKGGFGSGAAFAAVPLLALVVSAPIAAALMLPVLCFMDVFGLWAYWRRWSWKVVWPIMVTCVPGVIVGTLTFHLISAEGLKVLLGVMSLIFVGHQSVKFIKRSQSALPLLPARFRAWLWGPMAGFTSFALHAGGPPISFYLLPLKLDRVAYQASTVLFFWWVNLVKIGPYAYLDLFPVETLLVSLIFLPLAPLSFMLGVWANKRISDKIYFTLIYIFLTITGVKLVWDGLGF